MVYYIVPIIFLLISILIWFIWGKNEQIIDITNSELPEGFNCLEIGYFYNENNERNISALLIELANKGYINIVKENNDIIIKKIKEYDGDNELEKIFFDGIFVYKKENISERSVRSLGRKFYLTEERLDSKLNIKYKLQKYEKKSIFKIKYIVAMIVISLILMFISLTKDLNDSMFAVPIIFMSIILLNFIRTTIKEKNATTILKCIVLAGIGLLLGFEIFKMMGQIKLDYVVGLLCCIGMTICVSNMYKRSSYGTEMFKKINGYKQYFLSNCNNDDIYNALPYVWIFEQEDNWFVRNQLGNPDWYIGTEPFNIEIFHSIMNEIYEYMRMRPRRSSHNRNGLYIELN